MMLCLLNTIDNPNRDVYLAGTLRSPLFGFTLDELITVRQTSPEPGEPLYAALARYTDEHNWAKGRQFLDRLVGYRAMAEGTPVDRLLNQLYRDTTYWPLRRRRRRGTHSQSRSVPICICCMITPAVLRQAPTKDSTILSATSTTSSPKRRKSNRLPPRPMTRCAFSPFTNPRASNFRSALSAGWVGALICGTRARICSSTTRPGCTPLAG